MLLRNLMNNLFNVDPACLNVNTKVRCYYADPACPNKT